MVDADLVDHAGGSTRGHHLTSVRPLGPRPKSRRIRVDQWLPPSLVNITLVLVAGRVLGGRAVCNGDSCGMTILVNSRNYLVTNVDGQQDIEHRFISQHKQTTEGNLPKQTPKPRSEGHVTTGSHAQYEAQWGDGC